MGCSVQMRSGVAVLRRTRRAICVFTSTVVVAPRAQSDWSNPGSVLSTTCRLFCIPRRKLDQPACEEALGSSFCGIHVRRSLVADSCGLEALRLGGGGGAAATGRGLPIQFDGCLRRSLPRERTAPKRCSVAHRGLQSLRREVSGSDGLTDSSHRRVLDLR